MPSDSDSILSVIPAGPRTEETEGEEHHRTHIPRDEAKSLVWLSWRSNACEHGLTRHRFEKNGTIVEIGDLGPVVQRKKPKSVSSRQWEQGGRC